MSSITTVVLTQDSPQKITILSIIYFTKIR